MPASGHLGTSWSPEQFLQLFTLNVTPENLYGKFAITL
jgi:hypothetical protein